MAKYKQCPQCGQHVSPAMVECPDCEADLMGVPVMDDEEQAAPEQDVPEVKQAPVLVRRCDCGAENPPQARKCLSCGEDISDIAPAPAAAQTECVAELATLDGRWKTTVACEPVTLGREHTGSEYLSGHCYVARAQARVEWKDGMVEITSLSRSNPTFVNNVPMGTGETRTLQPGDEIGLGGCVIGGERQADAAYLVFRLV